MLPDPTERLRFRPMQTSDLDDITAVLIAFDVFGLRLTLPA